MAGLPVARPRPGRTELPQSCQARPEEALLQKPGWGARTGRAGSNTGTLSPARVAEEDTGGEELGEDAAERPDVDLLVVGQAKHDLGRAVSK